MLRFKIKLAFRNLLKNKLYSSLIIGGFAIGFTASILIGLFYNSEHNVNTHFRNYKNIYRVVDAKNNRSTMDFELYPVFNGEYPEIEKACPFDYTSGFQFNIKDPETKNFAKIKYSISTTNDFFDVFSIKVLASLSDKPFADMNSAVVTESVAKKLYGDENPLGRTIKQEFFTAIISAVMQDLPENSSFHADLLLNAENEEFQFRSECNNGICIYPTEHYLMLNNAVDPVALAEKINTTIENFNQNTDSLALQNVADMYLSSSLSDDEHEYGNSKMLVIFLSIAVLIILLSSINYLNYTVSIQYAKMKEIGINKTNGAGSGHLLIDSLIEVSLGVILALFISVLLVSVTLPYTDVLFGKRISMGDVNFQQLIPVFLATIAGIILLNSMAPIYVLSRFNITDFLVGGRKRNGRQIGKQLMLTFQLTVSIALIAVVLLIFKQLQYVKHYDLGFNEEHLVRLELPYLFDNPEIIKQETAKLSFVRQSALSDGYPGWVKLYMGSGTDDDNFMVQCIHVSDDYLETMGIELKTGRDFLAGDKQKACIMNEKAVKKYGWDSIDGKEYNNGDGYHVVGEVADFNVQSLHNDIAPVALIYDPEHGFSTLSLRLMPGNVGQQMAQVQEVWKKILPDEPMEFTFYDDQFQAMYTKEDKLSKSISFFSFIAIVLTCMGILGQIFLISLNRTKEIGVRKVNGATISEILVLLNKDFVIWVVVALVIASPIAHYAMNKWLENFAYKTNLSWWIFALAGVLTLGIALLTVSWQSWRAATRNPVEALRYE
ncbi:ABC transporter permease [uncultured Draconibacterium sp.]|uniref:ABC transporter permease n=1 Tax=uncultured Draconibacterium sp. TaxID=1573823 RepID=UPI002AA72B3A|nr:ABC transporter permease [uncultured Draconibacterium sp.]